MLLNARRLRLRNGNNEIILLAIEDITERKLADQALRESEANLRDLFQQSPDIIMTVDRKGTILLMNRSIPALPAERAVGRNSLALIALYAIVAISSIFAMFFAFSQWLLDQPLWALWALPLGLGLTAMVYGTAYVGQRLGADQTHALAKVVTSALDLPEDAMHV